MASSVGERGVDATKIDLNVVECLRIVLEERSVTKAAHRIGISQPSMSNLIGRLRRLTGDPLFVRNPDGMSATPFATALVEASGAFLHQVRELATLYDAFDPATSTRRFTIQAGDYATATIMPLLMKQVRSEAPGVSLVLGAFNPATLREALEGYADFAIAPSHNVPDTLYRMTLPPSEMVCIASANHPTIGDRLSVEDFINAPHATLSYGPSHTPFLSEQLTDDLLASEGRKRFKAIQVPTVLALPALVAESDLVAVVPDLLARRAARAYDIKIFPLPLAHRSPQFMVLWHRRAINDPGSKWLRSLLRAL